LFLDRDRQYSCAYFDGTHDDLDRAQEDKKRHIAGKLLLNEPGKKVLDIGSGWGGMALYLAKTTGADVTGVTLSKEQHKVSEKRAADAGLSDRVRFKLQDYRDEPETFDRIVSVGMFEHVGAGHYLEYFRKAKDLLTDDGVFLLHSIGRMEPPGTTNAWLRKYIFPGGYTPALSETLSAIEKAGLWVTDIEILRLHYAETLHHWYERFMAQREKALELYDERFCRMWEFYLIGCEISFRRMGQMVFQIQIAKRQDAVPLTRDYMTDWDRAASHSETKAAE
ncbi:MAG: cyclopropane-fatty-acyl-phospholipid synthase family protein, partial [Rhodospirillaceae bacterium]